MTHTDHEASSIRSVNVIITRSSKEVGMHNTSNTIGDPKDNSVNTSQVEQVSHFPVRIPSPQELNSYHVEKQSQGEGECHYSYTLETVPPEISFLQLELNPLELKLIPKNRKMRKMRVNAQLKMMPVRLKRTLRKIFYTKSPRFQQSPDLRGPMNTLPQLDKHSLVCLYQYARWKPP